MIGIFAALCFFGIAAVIAWNFVPAIRDRLKGWTTVLEGALSAGLYWFGQITGALQDAQHAGYLPSQIIGYLPYVMLAWFIYKRFVSDTSIGSNR